MIVYAYKDQFARTLAQLEGAPEAFVCARAAVRSFDDRDVAHVHLEPAVGRAAGNPGLGLVVAVRLPAGRTVASLSAQERLNLIRAALPTTQPKHAVLVMFCSRAAAASDIDVIGFWFDPADQSSFVQCDVRFVPDRAELFSRHKGLLETDLLADRAVLIVGLGSGGSMCALELAKCGVGRFILIDHDRLELSNVTRHACGISDLGRFKTLAVRDLILDKNPMAEVRTFEENALDGAMPLNEMVRQADVVLAATDNNESRRAINAACLEHSKVCLFGRAMQRACGGDVLRMRPRAGPCYECVLSAIWKNQPEEVSSAAQARELSYSDRVVTPEPGLSNDIAPIVTMLVKLALNELTAGTDSSLRSLNEDLTADLYMWANRREEQYAGWPPMQSRLDGLAILRWLGIRIDRNPNCPACGDSQADLEQLAEDIAFFSGNSGGDGV